MKPNLQRQAEQRQRNILHRLKPRPGIERARPMMTAAPIHYQATERVRAIAPGGIGAIHNLAHSLGLVDDIDRDLHLLKRHLPYHESDHVLNIAYNLLTGGRRLEHIERRRHDEVYLDALGAERIPDPTTAGDFCRRFTEEDVRTLMEIFNQTRLRAWAEQPPEFFDVARIDVDGTLAPTDGRCKRGIDRAYNGTWGYHVLVVSLANTAEPLYLVNRSGNRPSHEQADVYLDRAIALCRRAGFRRIRLRGDTDFSQTAHLDRWDQAGDIRFIFGIDAMPNLVRRAQELPAEAWSELERPARYPIRTVPRQTREDVRGQVVSRRGYKTLRLIGEEVAEFADRPVACHTTYRVIVLRKHLETVRGEEGLSREVRYFFDITNDREATASEVVFEANDRCDQENLIAQLKGGLKALALPVDDLVSNWAYMVMASLAWSLKAWSALLLPERGDSVERDRSEKRTLLRMEFTTYCAALIEVPCQIVRIGRQLIYRLLSWTPWQGVFLRLVERLRRYRR